MKFPKIRIGRLLGKVAKAAAPLVVAAVTAAAQKRIVGVADKVASRVLGKR